MGQRDFLFGKLPLLSFPVLSFSMLQSFVVCGLFLRFELSKVRQSLCQKVHTFQRAHYHLVKKKQKQRRWFAPQRSRVLVEPCDPCEKLQTRLQLGVVFGPESDLTRFTYNSCFMSSLSVKRSCPPFNFDKKIIILNTL